MNLLNLASNSAESNPTGSLILGVAVVAGVVVGIAWLILRRR